MSWEVQWTERALREAEQLEPSMRERVFVGVDRLALDPRSGDVKKLAVSKDLWRLRVGQWRVRFRVDKATRTLLIVRVLPRGSACRDL